MSVKTAAATEPTRSAETPTKVYQLIIQTKTYSFTVAAKSAEQARAGWEANEYEYTANHEPDYDFDEQEKLIDVVELPDWKPEDAEVDFEEVCGALGNIVGIA